MKAAIGSLKKGGNACLRKPHPPICPAARAVRCTLPRLQQQPMRQSHLATATTSSSGSGTAMIEPAVHNATLVRGAVLAGVVALAAKASPLLPTTALNYTHVMAFAIWTGTTVYTTFVAGIMLFKNLPRQTFGRVQSKLFPIYFFINAACISVCLGTSMARGDLASWAVPSLGAAFVSTLLNIFWLEPATTSCMFSMYALENDGKKESEVSCMFSMESDGKRESEEYKGLRKKFGPLHGVSSLVNLVALSCAFAHGYILAGLMA